MKLRSKINLYTTVLFICLLVLINGSIYFTFSRMILKSELQRTAAESVQTVKGMKMARSAIPTGDLLRAYVPVNGMLKVVRADSSIDAAITAPGHQNLIEIPNHYYQQEQRKIIKLNGVPHAFVSIPIIWKNGEIAELQATESLATTAQNLRILIYVLIAVTLLAAIPAFISSRILSNLISQPISSMIRTMREIRGSGQYKRIELPKQSKDELYQMGETFNEMIRQLKLNYEKQEQFVSNASHELKTPLTVIESYANLLKRRGKTAPELFDESVEAIHSEAIRMKELTQQLLLLARHDEQWKITMEIISLKGLAEESIRSFRTAFHREIDLVIEQPVVVKADVQKLKQLIYILMENAHKYSDAPITVKVLVENNRGVLEIIDRGIGIPASEISKVFDRFYRVDKARTRKSGGFGLGLSLAREIAEAMNAELRLESVEGQGTSAQIWLKLADSH
ncbi:HAMP domain-containing histidine kinase [Bacillus sp. FJAT-49731]|nr:HAMP domain-containing sensor histidine kinase [Lederbergia citrea]MBS4178476.1 HAMP domain-containing histidine kinase [Lederbergia citrea]MBS4205148.1 HAMP domain-containing histidine kinase [Lederbergia citrea]